MRYYLLEVHKLKEAAREKRQRASDNSQMTLSSYEESALDGTSERRSEPPSSAVLAPVTTDSFAGSSTAPSKASATSQFSSPQKPLSAEPPTRLHKASPGFQLPSPQKKPLTATASLFSSILDSPDKPKEAVTGSTEIDAAKGSTSLPQPVQPPKSSASSPFKFTPVKTTTTTQSSAPAAFQVPKFGNVAPSTSSNGLPKFGGGAPANFLSSFGAQAAKEAEKDKAKRKAEDFDSDEDDEAEWERQDKEKQEAKRLALAQTSKKVMKNVNGKFEWVDADEPVASSAPVVPASSPQSNTGTSIFSNSTSGAPSPVSNPFAHLSQSQRTNGIEATDEADQDTDEDDEEDETSGHTASNAPTTPFKGGSLFDRIDKTVDSGLQREGPGTATKPLFNFSAASPSADNTWKPESPIKFGGAGTGNGSTTPVGSPVKAAFSFGSKTNDITSSEPVDGTSPFKFGSATPKFSFGGSTAETPKESKPFASLFPTTPASGSVSPAPSIFGNIASAQVSTPGKGSSGLSFNFGGASSSFAPGGATLSAGTSIFDSRATSRATTPGATTADESSTAANTDNEEETAPPEDQRNLTSLSAEEQRTEEVLFEQKARCRKFIRGAKEPWENKGVGIIRLLRNKESANVRVLMRLDPRGTIVINANLIKDAAMYEMLGEKAVKLIFAESEGELTTYVASFGTKEKADELLGKIQEAI